MRLHHQLDKEEMTVLANSQTQASLSRQERDTLVLSQLTEVRFIAQRIHRRLPAFVPLDDLVHSGVLGLMEAAHKYDSTKNIQFKTFAQFRIRGAILDSLRELDRASRRIRAKSRMLNAACERLSQKLGREPTEQEIADELGLYPAALRKLASTLRSLELVDREVSYGQNRAESRDWIESAPANPEESPFVQCLHAEMKQQLTQAMSLLSTREKEVLSLHYFEQLTMQEIASMLDLGSSRISQIHSAALAKLRVHLECSQQEKPA
jgi:RNA polymerase sigma factor for flagellar operon FliA